MNSPSIRRAFAIACLLSSGSLSAAPLDILASYKLALQHDSDYQAGKADAQARQKADLLNRAQLLPSVSANLTYFDNSLQTSTDTSSRFDKYPSSSSNLSFRQPLFRLPSYYSYLQGRAERRSGELLERKVDQDLVVRLASIYLNVTTAQFTLDAIEQQLAAAEGQHNAARASMAAGQGTRVEVDETRARMDLLKVQLVEAAEALSQARQRLSDMTGSQEIEVLKLDPNKIALAPLGEWALADWVEAAESANIDLKRAAEAIKIAEREVDKSWSSRLPTADLVAQRSVSSSDNIVNPGARFENKQIGVVISVPLYQGGYAGARYKQTNAELRKARAQYDATRKQIALAVRASFSGVVEGAQKVRALEQAELSATQVLKSTQVGVRAGTRSQLDVLNAQQAYANTLVSLNRERVNYVIARLSLRALAGQLDVQGLEEVNSWLAS
jgi:outer membrane protein, protease secretion system